MSEAGRSQAIVTNFRALSRPVLSDHDLIIPGAGQPVEVRWVLKPAGEGDTATAGIRYGGSLEGNRLVRDVIRLLEPGAAARPAPAR